MILTSQDYFHESMENKLNSGKGYYNLIENLISFRLISKHVNIKILRTLILAVALYTFETLSLIIGNEHKLRVFKEGVQRGIFLPKRDEVKGGCRKLHTMELRNLYSLRNIIRMNKS
jgi:hypothetical protein